MNDTQRRIIRVMIGLAAAGAALQLVRPTITNPPVVSDLRAPDDVHAILERACYDCHSFETRLPWYDQVVPAMWLVARDVERGRERLNFSTFGELPPAKQRALMFESINMIRLGAMPPGPYMLMHPDAVIDHASLERLERYLLDTAPKSVPTKSSRPVLANVKPAPNGQPFPLDYESWQPISMTDRFDNDTMRVVLANRTAMLAASRGPVTTWPEGAALAKVAWHAELGADGVRRPGAFKQVEFMFKNERASSDTEGWAWARWVGTELTPYGDSASFASECTGCHAPMAKHDYVFTEPVASIAEAYSRVAGKAADGGPRVLSTEIDRNHGTMAMIVGNESAFRHAREQPDAPYPEGSMRMRMTWDRRHDPHWFGAAVPAAKRSVERIRDLQEAP